MANSMTGYGIGSVATDNNLLTVEIKAVNHRFLEVYVRLPKAMIALEDRVKKLVQNRLSRGKLDILVTLEQVSAKKVSVTVDNELAIAYYNSLAELALKCGLSSE
ncbi:MAG: YicC/YloC family endoribonuclease, partial [Clostridiales bacterium]